MTEKNRWCLRVDLLNFLIDANRFTEIDTSKIAVKIYNTPNNYYNCVCYVYYDGKEVDRIDEDGLLYLRKDQPTKKENKMLLCTVCGTELKDGVCPKCNKVSVTVNGEPFNYTIRGLPSKVPFKCPICDGTGKVSRPPHIAGDVQFWSDNQTGPYSCQACQGTGIVWGPLE